MRSRTPSLASIFAVLGLIIAATGVSFAAANVGHTGGSATTPGAATQHAKRLSLVCPNGARKTFGLCMQKAASGPASIAKARSTCDKKGGRLPTLGELDYIATLPSIIWANSQPQQYEYTSTNSAEADAAETDLPIARDRAGNIFWDARGQHFYYHCLAMPKLR